MAVKILLDTDIGSDLDDSICLAYLLAKSSCQLLGITTVSGEAEKRAMLASVLCKVAGKNVPIFPGIEAPLLVSSQQQSAQQADALKKWTHDTKFPKGQAVQFLRDTIYQHPGEITLLTIGPLTNIALLFTLYPETPRLLKGLVMMCGLFTSRMGRLDPREWNAKFDPHATAIVYKREVMLHHSIGADVSNDVVLEVKDVQKRFQTDLLRPVLDFADVLFQYTNMISFHAPLAAVSIFDDQICQMAQGNIEVELTSERLLGFTHWEPAPFDGKHHIATAINRQWFFGEFFSVFT